MVRRLRVVAEWTMVGVFAGVALAVTLASLLRADLSTLEKLSQIGVGALTVPLVVLSYVLFRETRRTRLENSEPRIVITIESNSRHPFVDVVIENTGKGVAKEVRSQFDPDLTVSGGIVPDLTLGSFEFLNPPILKPGQRMSQSLGRLNQVDPHRTTVTCISTGDDGRVHTHESFIDLRTLDRTSTATGELDEIAKHLKSLAASFSRAIDSQRLQVDVHTGADRIEEREQLKASREAMRARMEARSKSSDDG